MIFPSKFATVLLLQAALLHNALYAYAFYEPFNAPVAPATSGWNVQNGSASLVTGQPGAVGSALQLSPSAGEGNETRVVRPITWNAAESIAFIDFLIKPAANPEGSLASIYVNGTQVAFQVPGGSENGEVWGYHGNQDDPQEEPEAWLKTPAAYQVSTSTLQATGFSRVTLRHDYGRKVWDLFVDGKMSAANLGFEGRGVNLDSISFYGSEVAAMLVDELKADPVNMLFPDADKDGLPDAWETANGSNPNLYDRDAINPATGKSFLDGYLASLWSGVTAPNGSSGGGAVSSASIPPLTILSSHQPVGALKGSLSVGRDGSSTYSIPIDLPKGTAGMEPKLSLNYSSNGGNGQLGVGWALGGLQKIIRGASTAAKDGVYDPVDFDVNDRFFLDGERLVCVSGTHGAAGSEYRTEMDTYSRITLNSGTNGLWWKLETKAGLIVELGNTADSREAAAGTDGGASPGILSWEVNKVSDTVGNYYAVQYTTTAAAGFSSVDHRVSRIDYTGKDGTSARSPYCSIEFDYVTRPDQGRAYMANAGYKVTQRMSRIRVKTGSFTNHSYRFTYQNSYQTGRSLLTRIQKFANDDDSLGVKPTDFTYDGLAEGSAIWLQRGGASFPEYGNNWDATGTNNSSLMPSEDGLSARLDGDVSRIYTLPSAATLYSDSVMTFEFRAENLTAAAIGLDTDTTFQAFPSRLAQIGGNYFTLAAFPAQTLSYSPATTGGWVSYSIPVGSFATGSHPYLVLMSGDTDDSDGISSVEFKNVRIYRTGSQVPGDVSPVSFGHDVGLPRFRDATSKDLGLRLMDLNADGLPDLCNWRATAYTTTAGVTTPATMGSVYRNTGEGFVADNTLRPPASMPLSSRESDTSPTQYGKLHKVFASVIDVNGDGRADLLAATNMKYVGAALSNDLTFHTLVNGVWQEMPEYKMPFRPKNVPSSAPHGGATRFHHYEWTDLDSDGYLDLLVYTTAFGTLVSPDESTVILQPNQSIAYLNKVHLGQGWVANTALALPVQLRMEWPTPATKGRQLIDLDGDGRQDITESISGGSFELRETYGMTSQADGTLTGWTWDPNNPSPWDLPIVPGSNEYNIALTNSAAADFACNILDLNGDGLPDLVRSCLLAGNNVHGVYLNRGGAFGRWTKELRTSGTAPIATQDSTYDIPVPLRFFYSNAYYPMGYEFTDLNGDGLPDVLMGQNTVNNDFNRAVINTGNGWVDRPAWGFPDGARFYNNDTDARNDFRRSQLLDLNGDGFPDLITGLTGQTPKVWINQCKREVLTSVKDGFDSKLDVEYRRLNDPTPVAGTTTPAYQGYTGTLPAGHMVIQDSRLVVARLKESDGRGGERSTRRHYGDLRADRYNESSLGFGWVEVYNELKLQGGGYQPQGYTRTETSRAFPYGGSPVLVRSYLYVAATDARLPGVPVGYRLVTEEASTYGELATTTGIGGTIRRPVQTGSVSKRWDLNGTLMAQNTTSQPVGSYDAYGFLTGNTITALDGSASTTSNTYTHTTTGGKWFLGRLSASSVTKTAPGKTTSVKSTSYTYHPVTGLLESETVQPGHALAVTKSYTRDVSGNILQTSATASGQTRTTSASYDANARFPVSETTGVGTVTYAYDANRALLLSSTNYEGGITSYDYDAFGTKLVTRNPDGTSSAEITRYATNADLPSSIAALLGGASIKWARASQASATPWSTVYFDDLGRELARETLVLTAFNGTATTWRPVYAVTCYDAKGRKEKASLPFHAGDFVYWSGYDYDAADRVLVTLYPDGTSDKVIAYGTDVIGGQPASYAKLQNRANVSGPVNPWDVQYLERWEDQHGRMIQSKDMSGLTNTFSHDVEGNLAAISVGGVTVLTSTWDVFGRRTAVSDADAGSSSTIYNGFGEVVSSTNAKGDTTTTAYDNLGRVTDVVRPNGEGTFHTTYRTSSPGKGKPESITGPNGWSEGVTYDVYARPVTTTTTRFGETFTTQTVYDALGRVSYSIDPGGLKVISDYDSSFSAKVRTRAEAAGGPAFTLWEARAYDANGRATQEFLAQGVTSDRSYVPSNGKLTSIQSTRAGTALQNLAYTWDSKTNLTSRTDQIVGRTEAFAYDTNNRLVSSVVGGQSAVTYGYTANGNLTQKGSDSLTYADSRPHAVSSATLKGQSRAYTYDANGAVTADGIRSYGWTSTGQLKWLAQASCPQLKNLEETGAYGTALEGIPLAVQYEASYAEASFDFDASGSRARQFLVRTFADTSSADVTTLYLGAYEREVHRTTPAAGSAGVVKTIHRHNLGTAIYTAEERTGAPGTEHRLTTLLTDHLGSTDVLLVGVWNGSAFSDPKAERQSFDAWGERRDGDTWAKYRTASGDARRGSATDHHRGFTGHEMLDDFGLIHMNGRIYDPELGRFLSPDPVVQVPEWSQNFNSYTYVLNNPLSLTDSSGYFIDLIIAAIYAVVQAVVSAVTAYVGAVAAAYATGGLLAAAGTALGGLLAPGVIFSQGAFFSAWGVAQLALGAYSVGSTIANGGGFGDVLLGIAVNFVSGAISSGPLHSLEPSGGLGNAFAGAKASMTTLKHIAGHALLGGVSRAALGGRFEDGLISAAVSTAMMDAGLGSMFEGTTAGDMLGRTAIAGIVGGTVAEIGGGKFANGAFTSAWQHLLNAEVPKSSPVEKVSDEQMAKVKEKFTKAGFPEEVHKELMKLQSSPLGREILVFLADQSGFNLLKLPAGARSQVAGDQFALKANIDAGTIAHETQHLAEGMMKNRNYFRNVDMPGEYDDVEMGGYSAEYRAVRIQNQVNFEILGRPKLFAPAKLYRDEDRNIIIPSPHFPK